MMRAIGPVRLSKLADDTTSPPRQTGHIDDTARARGAEVVAYPTDLDVSAAKLSPFQRPQLGPWMTDPNLLNSYDALILWRWDRFVRNGQDMRDVFTWAKENNKRIISATENIEFNPAAEGIDRIVSELLITVVTAFAEIEVTNTSTRFLDMMDYLRNEGRPLSGHHPFGMQPGIDEDGKKNWVVSPVTKPIVDEIVRRLQANESRADIAADFNERGIHTPKDWSRVFYGKPTQGAEWDGATISHIFRSDALLGYRVKADPKRRSERLTLRGENGELIRYCAPVLAKPDGSPDIELLREVQKIIARKPRRVTKEGEIRNPLADILKCYTCKKNLNAANPRKRGEVVYHYVMCRRAFAGKCTARGLIPMDVAMSYLEDSFLDNYGNDPVVERFYVAQEDQSLELEELNTAFDAVSMSLETATSPLTIKRQTERLDSLAARIAELESQPPQAGGWKTEELDITNRERWEESDWEARRDMLLKAKITLEIQRAPRTQAYTARLVVASEN